MVAEMIVVAVAVVAAVVVVVLIVDVVIHGRRRLWWWWWWSCSDGEVFGNSGLGMGLTRAREEERRRHTAGSALS